MTPQTFIFIGRSGCGKGTQAKLIQDYLKKNDPERECLYIQTGAEFRKFIQGNSVTQKLSKEVYDKGAFQPEFLAIYMWTNILVNQYTTDEHIIMDGMPRMYHEAGVLDSIWSFYKLNPPFVVYMDISREESHRRLLHRHRFDDTEVEINARLDWFEEKVLPTLDFFKNNPDYNYLAINGEQDPDAVHKEILAKAKIA
jgi:adenylate kinase